MRVSTNILINVFLLRLIVQNFIQVFNCHSIFKRENLTFFIFISREILNVSFFETVISVSFIKNVKKKCFNFKQARSLLKSRLNHIIHVFNKSQEDSFNSQYRFISKWKSKRINSWQASTKLEMWRFRLRILKNCQMLINIWISLFWSQKNLKKSLMLKFE